MERKKTRESLEDTHGSHLPGTSFAVQKLGSNLLLPNSLSENTFLQENKVSN